MQTEEFISSGTGSAGGAACAIPPPLAIEFDAFIRCLGERGLRAALAHLNRRTPHRYTGVFRFDGDMLRSVALVDKWNAETRRGDDIPIASAYCAHLHRTGQPLDVEDGATDQRVPWMASSPVVSYCGAPILDPAGERWGALCHFDTARCESKNSDMPLLVSAASVLYPAALSTF
jgi:GAF domain-containing protein